MRNSLNFPMKVPIYSYVNVLQGGRIMAITVSLDRYKELVWNDKSPENIEKHKNKIREETRLGIERGEIIEINESMSIENMVKRAQEGDTLDIPAYVLEDGFAERAARASEEMRSLMAEAERTGQIAPGYDSSKLGIVNDGNLWKPVVVAGQNFFDYSYNANDETVSISFRSGLIPTGGSTADYISFYEKAYGYIEEMQKKIEADEAQGKTNPYSKDIIDIYKKSLSEAFAANPCRAISEQATNAGLSVPKAEKVSKDFSEQFAEMMESRSEGDKTSVKNIAMEALLKISSKYGMNLSLMYRFNNNQRLNYR